MNKISLKFSPFLGKNSKRGWNPYLTRLEASAINADIMESGAAVWLADSFRASASLSFDDKFPDLVDVIAEELEEP